MIKQKMTPQQIYDYKLGWKIAQNFYRVKIHSDLYHEAMDWCKQNLSKERWDLNVWTDVYEHTFLFEYKHNADEFSAQWPSFVNN